MNLNPTAVILILTAAILSGCVPSPDAANIGENAWKGTIIQHGKMREVIGAQQHQGRILLADAAAQPNLFAVGAIEGLTGEFTIVNSKVYATRASSDTEITPIIETDDVKAALLAGFQVATWEEFEINDDVRWEELEAFIEGKAKNLGIDTSAPFPFVIVGDLRDVEMHVIRGACPVHSKRNNIELSKDDRPFEDTFALVTGTLVGVFAKNAAGNLTHPDTSTHTHVVFSVDDNALELTGHVDSVVVGKGTILRLPK